MNQVNNKPKPCIGCRQINPEDLKHILEKRIQDKSIKIEDITEEEMKIFREYLKCRSNYYTHPSMTRQKEAYPPYIRAQRQLRTVPNYQRKVGLIQFKDHECIEYMKQLKNLQEIVMRKSFSEYNKQDLKNLLQKRKEEEGKIK